MTIESDHVQILQRGPGYTSGSKDDPRRRTRELALCPSRSRRPFRHRRPHPPTSLVNLQNANHSLHDTPKPCYTFTLTTSHRSRTLFGKETIDLARRSQSAGEQPHRSRNRSDTASTRCNSVFGYFGRQRHIVPPTKTGVLAYRFACNSRIAVDLNFSGRVRLS